MRIGSWDWNVDTFRAEGALFCQPHRVKVGILKKSGEDKHAYFREGKCRERERERDFRYRAGRERMMKNVFKEVGRVMSKVPVWGIVTNRENEMQ